MLEGHLEGRRVNVDVVESLFPWDGAYISEADFFDELDKDGEAALSRPWGVPLLAWETHDGHEPKFDNVPSTSI